MTVRLYFQNHSVFLKSITSLENQLKLKVKNNDYYALENKSLKKQNADLKNEVQKVKNEANSENINIFILKEMEKELKENYSKYENMKSQLSVREDELKQFQSMHKSLSQLLTQLSTLGDVQEMVGETTETDDLLTYYIFVMIKIISEERHKIKNLKDQLTKHRDSLVKEQSEKLQSEKTFLALLGYYQNENLFLQELVNKLGNLLITSDHQINTKQKTAGQNDPSSSKTVAEVVTDANQENAVPDSTVEECRIVTKNPKLHLRSDNGSDKNYVITSAVISTTEISSQSKRKLMLKLESLS